MGRNHATIIFLLQLGDTADVIAVVMGDEDIRQRPSLALQRRDDRTSFRRVDRGGGFGGGIVNQITEIIVEAGENRISADMGAP